MHVRTSAGDFGLESGVFIVEEERGSFLRVSDSDAFLINLSICNYCRFFALQPYRRLAHVIAY